MKNPVLTNAIKRCADPQRARQFLELLAATGAGTALQTASAEQARILAMLFSGSQALSNLLVARPEWFGMLEPEMLKFPRRKQGLRTEVSRWLKPLLAASDFGAALTRLREFKQREMLRIAGRDLARLGKLPEIVQEISDVADVCLEAFFEVAFAESFCAGSEPLTILSATFTDLALALAPTVPAIVTDPTPPVAFEILMLLTLSFAVFACATGENAAIATSIRARIGVREAPRGENDIERNSCCEAMKTEAFKPTCARRALGRIEAVQERRATQ